VNEVVWRNVSTDTWVAFKVWGVFPLTLLFAMAQTPFIARHQIESEETPRLCDKEYGERFWEINSAHARCGAVPRSIKQRFLDHFSVQVQQVGRSQIKMRKDRLRPRLSALRLPGPTGTDDLD
jgi:hypothetical protein